MHCSNGVKSVELKTAKFNFT